MRLAVIMFPASLLRSKFLHPVRRLKKIVQDNLHLRGHHKPLYSATDLLSTDRHVREKITAVYEIYTRDYSDRVFTLSLPTLFIFHNLVHKWKPDIILDLGSGLSTWVAHLASAANPNTKIVSFDTDAVWINTTCRFLKQMGIEQEIQLFSSFHLFQPEPGKRLLILNDLGDSKNFHLREESLPMLEKYIQAGALLLLDDLHKPSIRARAIQLVKQRNFRFFNLCKWTFDEYGRYAWLIHNEARV